MPQRSISRRLRAVTPKQIVLAIIVIGVFLLLITMLGQVNQT